MDLLAHFSDVGADFGASGEEKVVERELEQFFADSCSVAFNNGDFGFIEDVFDKRGDEGAHTGRLVAWLCYNRVFCGDGGNHRAYAQEEGVVPGGHDEYPALGLEFRVAERRWQEVNTVR